MIRKAEERTKAMIEWLDTHCPKMTKEEIINRLKLTIEQCLFDPYTMELSTEQISFTEKLTIDACKGAIDLLEQEPFINKPCVSEGVCHEDKIKVLDKIRNEVKALTDGAEPEHVWNVDVLAIIDKYKAESEE